MKFRAEMGNLIVLAGGVYAVGEKDDAEVSNGVSPYGCAGESEDAKGFVAKVAPARTCTGRDGVPAECPGAVGREVGAGGELWNAPFGKDACAEPGEQAFRQVMGCGKKASVGGDTAHCGGVFIVDFTVYEVIAQVGAIFRGRNAVFEMGRWTVPGVVHFERFEYVLFGEVIQALSADGFEDFTQGEEAEVALHGVCAGFIS